jgi:hypothetical protein
MSRITKASADSSEPVYELSDTMGEMTETILEEREELTKSYLLLIELKKLYDEEKALIADSVQQRQRKVFASLANEEVLN